jgi:hypothetical protein
MSLLEGGTEKKAPFLSFGRQKCPEKAQKGSKRPF